MSRKTILILGDIITLAILTFIGFATHGEAGISFLPRMAAMFFPLVLAWFVLAPWFDLFNENTTSHLNSLWRVVAVMVFVVPFASILRAGILGSAALPIFTLVLGATNSLGMLLWRFIYSRAIGFIRDKA